MAKSAQLTERQQYWLSHLQRCERDGGRLSDYAKREGLSLGALYEAKSKLRAKGALGTAPVVSSTGSAPVRSKFVRVESAPAPVSPPAQRCRVYLSNGTMLEVLCAPEQWPALFDAAARAR